ncbi:hypothetical protein jhhlp_008892 [Lomentospora prolificans]|uniref:Cytochrome b/b6 N-terminal region profile domain-containing protein n=1 Tax=Lomentospora prolificans TaxID=41688 RepID=A0A2N3MXE7_9PEZI|nr:hypothetical protein jhhlp_008892 [Lomentospora prolificans]
MCLGIQIVTGVTLAMHYNPSVAEAFNSIEHIMRDSINLNYWSSNTYINDGYSFLRIRFTLWSNVIMRCYSYY